MALTQFTIERFTRSHQKAASELINANLERRFGFLDVSKNPDLVDIEKFYGNDLFLVAIAERTLIGTGALTRVASTTGQIVRMHTLLDYQRQGVARALLQELERHATHQGFRRLILETNIDWYEAIGFYRANGYAELASTEVEIHFEKFLE